MVEQERCPRFECDRVLRAAAWNRSRPCALLAAICKGNTTSPRSEGLWNLSDVNVERIDRRVVSDRAVSQRGGG
jgi:hypothetical protein